MIGRRERMSYAAGDLGFNFVWQSIELYLLFFYIRGLGIAPEVASIIFLAGAAVDWVVDPLVGAAADRAAPRVPFRLWVVVAGPVSVLLLVLAFASPPVPPEWVPVVALLTYLALRIAYGVGNIPYGALTARISASPRDHLALTGARMQGAAIGGLIAALVFAVLPPNGGDANFRGGAMLLAALALPAFLATYLGVRERVSGPPPSRGATGSKGMWEAVYLTLALLRRSPALRRLLATILAAGLAVTVVNKSLLFLFDEIGALRIGYFVAMVPAGALLLTTPLWAALGARLGRPRTLLLAAQLELLATAAALVIPGAYPLVALTCVAIVAGCGMSVMFWSLVPGAVVECEREAADIGCAGRVYALANMARKLAQALAPVVVATTVAGSSVSTLTGMTASAAVALLTAAFYRPRDDMAATAPLLAAASSAHPQEMPT